MILPLPSRFIPGTTHFVQKKTDLILTLMTRSNSAVEMSSRLKKLVTPCC